MAEIATSAAGIAVAAGAATLSGSALGIPFDMLMSGFFGGMVSLSFLPQMARMKVATTVATSSIAAGFFGPALAVTALHYFPFLSELNEGLRLGAGAAIGLFFQTAVPALFRKIKIMGEQQ